MRADGPIEWGAANRPFPGEPVSGDACIVEELESLALAALIDGLGHGTEAAEAAAAAIDAIRAQREAPLPEIMRLAHRAMTGTRGGAVTLARFTPAGVELLAVGNVAGIVVRGEGTQKRVPLRGGIVGFRLPSLGQVDRVALEPGDHVLLASDGIRSAFSRQLDTTADPQAMAESLLAQWARDTDDATVFVARFLATA